MMSDELKALLPCPFCGGDPRCFLSKQDGLFYVRCMICGAETGPKFINSPDKQEATVRAAWNTRAAIEATTVKGGGLVGWQPIETAPKDGTHFLACIAQSTFGYAEGKTLPPVQTVVHWWGKPGEEGFYTSVNELAPERPFEATHWKPLDTPEAADTITTLKGEIERRDAALRKIAAIESDKELDAEQSWQLAVDIARQALGSTDNVG